MSTRAESWSRYWATGVRHSCATSFEGHYGPATRQFWRDQFLQFREGDTLLELGCGNGSLIRFLAESEVPILPRAVHAVDAAAVDTRWLSELPQALRGRVALHAQTPANALPLADRSVSVVVSQYALEYFADDAVWDELGRVTTSDARIAIVAHHRDSLPCGVAAAEQAHCDALLQAGGVLDCAERLSSYLARAATPEGRAQLERDSTAQRVRAEFNRSMLALEQRAEQAVYSDILHEAAERTMRTLQAAAMGNAAPALNALQTLRQQLQDNRLRVSELVQCALDSAAIGVWCERLRTLGFVSCDAAALHEQGQIFAWTLTARRQ